MTEEQFAEHSRTMFEAWNSQDVESVLNRYTPDCTYLDPNTGGPVEGREALRRYLTRLFERWQMTWEEREHHIFGEDDGVAVLWRATLRPHDGARSVTVNGMDLILMEGELVRRNEVYFDRARLAELFAPAESARTA